MEKPFFMVVELSSLLGKERRAPTFSSICQPPREGEEAREEEEGTAP
jgi:hypothetical protein